MPSQISFCITCMKRLYQLKETLPVNLQANWADRAIVEFVLADIGPTEGLSEWLFNDPFLLSCLRHGYLRVVQVLLKKGEGWHASWAKNTAHRAASPSSGILVNLDGDVFIGGGAGVKLIRAFRKHPKKRAFAHLAGPKGTYGCMAYPRDLFWAVGGYNQFFYPMGAQDVDLMARVVLAFGCPMLFSTKGTTEARWLKQLWPSSRPKPKMVVDPAKLPRPRALRNSKMASIANVSTSTAKLSYHRMNRANMGRCKAGLAKKHYRLKGMKGWAFKPLVPPSSLAEEPKIKQPVEEGVEEPGEEGVEEPVEEGVEEPVEASLKEPRLLEEPHYEGDDETVGGTEREG